MNAPSCATDYARCGELLLEAKAALPHGEWGRMVEEELPFNRKYAHRLMAVAENKVFSNVHYSGHLPSSPTTLYHLSRLDDDALSSAIPTRQKSVPAFAA